MTKPHKIAEKYKLVFPIRHFKKNLPVLYVFMRNTPKGSNSKWFIDQVLFFVKVIIGNIGKMYFFLWKFYFCIEISWRIHFFLVEKGAWGKVYPLVSIWAIMNGKTFSDVKKYFQNEVLL